MSCAKTKNSKKNPNKTNNTQPRTIEDIHRETTSCIRDWKEFSEAPKTEISNHDQKLAETSVKRKSRSDRIVPESQRAQT